MFLPNSRFILVGSKVHQIASKKAQNTCTIATLQHSKVSNWCPLKSSVVLQNVEKTQNTQQRNLFFAV